MSETVKTYKLPNLEEVIPMDRDAFYREQVECAKANKTPDRAVEVVAVFLFNTQGEILIQKRSFIKAHNAGQLDKSIGGHIKSGDTSDYTVMVETIQELQTPSIVLKNQEDFLKTLTLLHTYLETVSVIKYIKTELHHLSRIINGQSVEIINLVPVYFGVYNGRIRPVDREAKGVLWYSLDELEAEIKKLPEAFTFDIRYYVEKYREQMHEFVRLIKDK